MGYVWALARGASAMSESFADIASKASEAAALAEFAKRLKELGITDNTAPEGISLMSPQQVHQEVGFTKGTGAIKIKYPLEPFSRLRFLGEFEGNKYHQAEGSKNYLYITKEVQDTLQDISKPLFITEGEFKTIRAINAGMLCVGLGGVSSVTNRVEDDKVLLPSLATLPVDKKVYICFDYDPLPGQYTGEPKAEVLAAETRLAIMLAVRHCKVYLIRLGEPNGRIKIGLDDFLNAGGNILTKIKEARKFVLSKEHGVDFLLARYGALDGSLVHIRTHKVYSKAAMQVQEANCHHPFGYEGEAKISPIQLFLTSPNRLAVKGFTFDPSTKAYVVDNGLLNGWRGYKTQPVEGDVTPWLNFTKMFFSLEPEIQHHFDSCMALMLQKPWVRQDRLCILKSGFTGIGKSFYFETFAAIINGTTKGVTSGDHFDHALVTSGSVFDSSFNSLLGNKKLVVFNEIGERGEQHTNKIKDMVTSASITINEKFAKEKNYRNYMQICITTNEKYTHTLDADSRRELIYDIPRHEKLCLELRNLFATDKSLTSWVNTPQARSALLHYYLNYDVGSYNGTQPAPMNGSKARMAAESTEFSDAFIYITEEMYGIEYMIPKLEAQLLRQHYPNCRDNDNKLRKAFKQKGYLPGHWDTTHGQISFASIGTKNKELQRPTVYTNSNRKIEKDELFKILEDRYFGRGLK